MISTISDSALLTLKTKALNAVMPIIPIALERYEKRGAVASFDVSRHSLEKAIALYLYTAESNT